MDKYWRYICTVEVRPIGAQGVYTPVQFPVALKTPTAKPAALFASWQEGFADVFQPDVMTHVDGQPTCGEIDREFPGEEV